MTMWWLQFLLKRLYYTCVSWWWLPDPKLAVIGSKDFKIMVLLRKWPGYMSPVSTASTILAFISSFRYCELFNSLALRQTQIILFTFFWQGSLSHWSISSLEDCLNCLQANKRLFPIDHSNLSLWKAKIGKPHCGVFSGIIFHSSFRAIFKVLLLYWPLLNRLSAI